MSSKANRQNLFLLCSARFANFMLRPKPHRTRDATHNVTQANGTCWCECGCPHCMQATSKEKHSNLHMRRIPCPVWIGPYFKAEIYQWDKNSGVQMGWRERSVASCFWWHSSFATSHSVEHCMRHSACQQAFHTLASKILPRNRNLKPHLQSVQLSTSFCFRKASQAKTGIWNRKVSSLCGSNSLPKQLELFNWQAKLRLVDIWHLFLFEKREKFECNQLQFCLDRDFYNRLPSSRSPTKPHFDAVEIEFSMTSS